MRLLFDSEFDGLSPTVCWCLVAKDVDTGEVYEWGDEDGVSAKDRDEIMTLFCRADKVVGHNILAFDLYWLDRIQADEYGAILPRAISDGKEVDTLVISRLLNPDRPGGHSVEAWAKEKGWPVQKVAHEDWSRFSPEMLERCRADVEIQERIYRALQEEARGWDWSLALRIEHAIAPELAEQERRGVAFDQEGAESLLAWLEGQMNEAYDKLKGLIGSWPVSKGEVKRPFKKDGTYTKMVGDWLGESHDLFDGVEVGGPFGRIEWQPIELSQTEKVAKRLMQLGWEPTEYTEPTERHPHGLPKLRPNKEVCPNLLKMDNEAGVVLAEYSKYQHRYGQIKGWVENCKERGDGRVSAAVAGITNTGRRRHAIVANVPKAKDHVFLGKEMRGLFRASEDRVLVGWDAASAQLRIGAHYANDKKFAEALVNGKEEEGTDAHSIVMKRSGLANRDEGKKGVYTGIFGGSEKKFVSEFGPVGREVRRVIYDSFPGVLALAPKVNKAAERGYLKGLDGRKIWMRRDEKGKVKAHAGLVTLIQSAEGILMAFVYALLAKEIKRRGIDAWLVIFSHDEVQADVHPDHAEAYIELSERCMKRAEKFFRFRCPLAIEAKVGKTWAETH